MNKETKIVLYLTKEKDCYLKYLSIDDIKKNVMPEEYNKTKVLKNLDEVKEKWEIKNVVADKDGKKLTIDFKLLFRKIKKK